MKPFFEKIDPILDKSYFIRKAEAPFMTMSYHYHPEVELTFTAYHKGKRFVGNHIAPLDDLDLIFLGPNLPHAVLSDKSFEFDERRSNSYNIVLQFNMDIFKDLYTNLPEMEKIFALIEKSNQGMEIQGASKQKIIYYMKALVDAEGMSCIIIILQILQELVETSDYQLLSSHGFTKDYYTPDFHRLNRVYDYIIKNFRDEIHLGDVARIANMTETAFCRFFKQRTLKTFTQTISEMRINFACTLLKMDTFDVKSVAEEVGYKNLSNFNRQFKNVTGYTPLSYAKKFR